MRFTLDMRKPRALTFATKGMGSLQQQLFVLLDTQQGSVPLDRDFGINWNLVDTPVNALLPLYVAEVSKKIERYIPALRVLSTHFPAADAGTLDDAAQGITMPILELEIRPEYAAEA
jgi:phage baseplate assembly protein W